MINTLCMTYLFIFFIIFLNKTDGQTLERKSRVCLFLDGGSKFYPHIFFYLLNHLAYNLTLWPFDGAARSSSVLVLLLCFFSSHRIGQLINTCLHLHVGNSVLWCGSCKVKSLFKIYTGVLVIASSV